MKSFLLTLIAGLFALTILPPSAHAQLRPMVYADTTVEADVQRVWEDWTTAEGLTGFFAKDAVIEPRPGGDYIVIFAPDAPEGSRGSDTGMILGLQDDNDDGSRMISFTWAMPPYMPEIRPHMTAVQIWFVPDGAGRTRLRLFHTGFGDSQAWQDGRAYFSKTWPEVLRAYQEHIREQNAAAR